MHVLHGQNLAADGWPAVLHMQTVLVPGPSVGCSDGALGLFAPAKHVAAGQAFGWELIMTFVLVRCLWWPHLRPGAGVQDITSTHACRQRFCRRFQVAMHPQYKSKCCVMHGRSARSTAWPSGRHRSATWAPSPLASRSSHAPPQASLAPLLSLRGMNRLLLFEVLRKRVKHVRIEGEVLLPAAGSLTGAGLNPARVLGPAIVYNASWSAVSPILALHPPSIRS